MTKFTLFKTFILSSLLMLVSLNVQSAYSGTGTFNKITSLTELTDGYYVVVNSGDGFAMNNSNAGSYFTHTVVTPTNGSITDPSTNIVWEIKTHVDGGNTIFNEATSKYVSYSGSSNAAYAVSSITGGNERWTITYASSLFSVTNVALSTRILQYNASFPRFACYTSAQQKFLLYKLSSTTTPTITTPSPTSLSSFACLLGNASPSQTFTVGGSDLTADLVVTAPTNFEVRESGVGSFASSVAFTPASGTVSSKTIEVRIASTAPAGSVSGNVVCSSTGASSQNVAVSGNVTSVTPTIIVTEVSVPAMTAIVGNVDSETINISGTNLTGNIVVTIDGTNGSMFSVVTNPSPLTSAGGTATITYTPTAQGTHTATLHVNSTGATEVTRTLNGTATIDNPVATVATAITSVGFNANWNQVAGATAYELVVEKVVSGGSSAISDLIISEYVEGTSYNKAIEIYNGTGVAIDLSAYSVKKQANGAGLYSSELVLTGSLANNDFYIIANTAANAAILAMADITNNSTITFNGNDAVGLFKNGVLIDEVGVFNQVADWGKDLTLIRKGSVTSPKATYDVAEWDILATDDISNLNSHSVNLQTLTPIAGSPFTINGGSTTTYAIAGLTSETDYTYKVRATDGSIFTPYSNPISLTTTTSTGLKNLHTSRVYTLNGNIYIQSDNVNRLEIFNSVGQKLMDKSIQTGLNTINVNAKGVLFVKMGNEITKVIL